MWMNPKSFYKPSTLRSTLDNSEKTTAAVLSPVSGRGQFDFPAQVANLQKREISDPPKSRSVSDNKHKK